ncbi:MAG: cellulase family glycosylhydrolase, partial [Candidatus Omnitrophica bacterium]|nr:cellulase family glycosylhydrolase [Candidatus Omnitrophota bacterium]
NPKEIDLGARFVVPGGKIEYMPAFFTGAGNLWKIRYTPRTKGDYSYHVILKTPAGEKSSPLYAMKVAAPGDSNGFLRKSRNNLSYLAFDSGKPFFGLGHNIAWVSQNDTAVYESYFAAMAANGCNMARIWINSPWTFCVEYKKIGVYNCDDCAKIDSLIKLAEKYGIYIVLVLDSYGSLMGENGDWEENKWNSNPYNKLKGGFCQKPWDFFTDKNAIENYKNRLRYIIARWSYSTNVLAFELWNEVDLPKDWAAEIASYMKSVNPHGQLITTSLKYPWDNVFDESSIWTLKDIDIIERHLYGNDAQDIIGYLISSNKVFAEKYGKPILIGEFGMDSGKDDKRIDPDGIGVALHNSIWASAMTKSLGGALNWWWAGYVRANDLYFHYKALRDFVDGVDWNSARVELADVTPLVTKPAVVTFSDISVIPAEKWGDTSYGKFTVHNNGDLSGGMVNYYLHGMLKKEFRIEPVFHVNYPKAGKFTVKVGTVSQGGKLVIYLDGKAALEKEFPAGPGEGPWVKSLYRKDYNIYQCVYNSYVAIDVPEGPHTIKLANYGKDWIGIKRITLGDYNSNAMVNARLAGLIVGDKILLWIQNKDYNYKKIRKGTTFPSIENASFSIHDIENGDYRIEWWDTVKGGMFSVKKIKAEKEKLYIAVPPFSKDLACKIIK